jgi:hypothetical protein
MSLLITSNTPESINSGYQQEGINKSYSYQNNLNDTFKIPANSEIAVQSVKINRSGNIDINEANSIYSFYFGQEIDGEDVFDGAGNAMGVQAQRDVLSIPWSTSIGGDLDLLDIVNAEDYDASRLDSTTVMNFTDNVNNIARRFKATLNRSLWHPMLQQNASSTLNPGANVQVLRNGSNVDFLGFKLQVTNTDSSKNASHISASWLGEDNNGTSAGENYSYNPSTRILTAPATDLSCVGTQYPLSLANGSFSASLVKRSGGGLQRIGLTRALGGAFNTTPDYFEEDDGNEFYDYVCEVADDGEISVFFAGCDGSALELEMVELNYGAKVNASTSEINVITFNIQNERVKINLTNKSGVITTLCDGTSTTSGSNVKPVSMTCRYLYPKIQLEPTETIKINEYFGVDILNHSYGGMNSGGAYTFHDWYATQMINGNVEQAKLIDCNAVKNITRTHQIGLNGNGQCDYKVQFFFAPDSRYWNTAYCNSQFLVGYPNRSLVNVPTSTGGSSPFTLTFDSDSAPEMKGTQSLFVRLKNMTFTSVNLAKGSQSKILYHLPAFSNSGQRVGALFFEPGEKVYLKLNNPSDLFLSTVEIDLVYSDETLATDLQGKTTVVLHIRDT